MKICYLSASLIPSRSANSLHVMKMCNALGSLGHIVTLFVPRTMRVGGVPDAEVFRHYGVPMSFSIVRVPLMRGRLGVAGFAWATARAVRKQRPDLIHGRSVESCYSAAVSGHDVSLEMHDAVVEQAKKAFGRLVELRRFRSLVVNSEGLRRHYEERYERLAGRIIVAHNGADVISDGEQPQQLAAGRASRLQVGYVGQLYQGRGIELIVALAALCPWADFHIVGGTEEDLARWRTGTPARENLHWHGFMQPSATGAFRRGCDVLLAPYQTSVSTAAWMSPLKVFEYMAAGKAIVASDLPVLHEVLQDEYNALLCPPESIMHWVAALTRLREQTAFRHQLGQRAKEEFRRKHTWAARAEYLVNRLGHNGTASTCATTTTKKIMGMTS